MCRAETGEIFETEAEVASADDARFKRKMKIDLETAKKTALERFPGTVPLAALKSTKGLEEMMVTKKGVRLSVQPVTKAEYEIVARLGRRTM